MQSSNPISVNLLNLHELTTAKIDMAIKILKANNIPFQEDSIDELYRTMDLPWGRLDKILNQNSQQGLSLLALLLGIDIYALINNPNIITLIKDDPFVLKAVNIFLQHMINGNAYVSQIRPEYKPVHMAVRRLMGQPLINMQLQVNNRMISSAEKNILFIINVIARLMIASWEKSGNQLSSEQVAQEIINLNIAKRDYRDCLAQSLLSKYNFNFTAQDLFSALDKKAQLLARNEITLFSQVIAKGGNGVVYKGRKNQNGKNIEVAIKLNQINLHDETICYEAIIHQQLNHPNIIKYICDIERSECKGIVLDYANGGSLESYILLKRESTIQANFASIALQTLSALKYLQTLEYVHLDLKPGNILIKTQNKKSINILLSDFGSMSKQGSIRSLYLTTWWYTSPERCNVYSPAEYANDVFSFGCVLGEMETRENPFTVADPEFIKKELTEGRRATFNNKSMRKEVEAIVQLCWKQNPAERPNYDQLVDHIRKAF